jgi:hypothetical protein
MRRWIFVGLTVMSVVWLLAGGEKVRAASLSVATYCELSVARLQLATDTWEKAGRSPTGDEEAILWQRYGTIAEEYYAFGSAHREEVNQYLTTYPEVSMEVERLSARLEELIEQAEARQ